MRQEKGLCAIVAQRSFIQTAATIGLTTSFAFAIGGGTATNISLHNNSGYVNSNCGIFKTNVGVNSMNLGDKKFQITGEDFHIPIAVKLFEQSNTDSQKFEPVADSAIGTKNGAFQFELSADVDQVPGTTALDIAQSPDLGRMLAPTGTRATRTQIFLSLPERDNNAQANAKIPDLILMGAVPNGTIKITPILAGNAEIQESLIFGRTLDIEPSDIASGKTGITIIPSGSSPKHICIIGLDISGDFQVQEGHKVVGYQLESPAGSNSPIKLMPVGQQESAVFASNSITSDMIALGSPDILQVPSYTIYAQALPSSSTPSMNFDSQPTAIADNEFVFAQIIAPIFKDRANGRDAAADNQELVESQGSSARQNYDSPGSDPPISPVVPVPGAITLLGMAAGFISRRRNTRTQL
ncbi:MAG: hypothetical protein EXS12_05140 [Phycisphaerales bacterium]|nr:hypothetical protein [Phycisphaerales bacterium]